MADDRAARLAEQLRANLQRRKGQRRARAAPDAGETGRPGSSPADATDGVEATDDDATDEAD